MEEITHNLPGAIIIGIDCATMSPRPDTYIKGFADILGVVEIPEVSTKLFGAWSWEFPDMTKEAWDLHKKTIISLAEKLYKGGSIRGAQHFWKSAISVYITDQAVSHGLHQMLHLSPENIAELLEEGERARFVTDFEYAKSAIDQIYSLYKTTLETAKELADT